jgi:hypothetical protein
MSDTTNTRPESTFPGPQISKDDLIIGGTLTRDGFESISVARVGKQIAINFHTSSQLKNLPNVITVGLNGVGTPAYDYTGTGVYTIYVTPKNKSKLSMTHAKAAIPAKSSADSIIDTTINDLKIKFKQCEAGCKSILFGTDCVVCIDSIEF